MKYYFNFDRFNLQVEHIFEESNYNHNLYKVVGNYGDLFSYRDGTLFIKEKYDELWDSYEYTFLLEKDNKYIEIMSFVGNERIYNDKQNPI